MKQTLIFAAGVFAALACAIYFLNSRAISQEPLFFGHVVFGQENTTDTIHLFIVRGRQIFLDANGDHRPQNSEELRQSSGHLIQQTDSNLKFKFASIDIGISPDLLSETRLQKLIFYVDINSEFEFQMTGQMELSKSVDPSNYLHFGGPLEFLALDEIKLNNESETPQDIKIYLGTVSGQSSNTTVVVPNENPPYPKASIRFADGNPLPNRQEFTMDHFC